MNTQGLTVKITMSNPIFLPRHVWFTNKVFVNLHNVIKELVEDQNGMVTYLGLYPDPLMSCIELNLSSFSPRHISQHLQEYITCPLLCQALSERIAFECASLPQPFAVSFYVEATRDVRIMLPFVTVPLKAASRDVFQRLFEEQRVDSIDLDEEEAEATCSICLENLLESHDENIIKMPKCLHLFHQGCIFEWLKQQNSCPLCRSVPYE